MQLWEWYLGSFTSCCSLLRSELGRNLYSFQSDISSASSLHRHWMCYLLSSQPMFLHSESGRTIHTSSSRVDQKYTASLSQSWQDIKSHTEMLGTENCKRLVVFLTRSWQNPAVFMAYNEEPTLHNLIAQCEITFGWDVLSNLYLHFFSPEEANGFTVRECNQAFLDSKGQGTEFSIQWILKGWKGSES